MATAEIPAQAATSLPKKPMAQPKKLPEPNSDFYQFVETLPADELAVVKRVRTFVGTKLQPIITKYWVEDEFPFELLPVIKGLNITGLGIEGYGCPGGSQLLQGRPFLVVKVAMQCRQ